MKLKITAFLAAWLTIASTFAYAQQTFNVSGKITDDTGKPLDAVTICLKKATDSTLIKTALADAAGNFVFQDQKPGDYRLTVSMLGFGLYKSEAFQLNADKAFSVIALKRTATALAGVTISSQKPLIEHKIDRTVVNVDALISNAGSTALEVLEKSPGVIIDENGGISLKGKPVQVFIDDRPSNLSGVELQSYLKSIASSGMDQVELMSNPPAKYDAAGNGGIINIRTKKSKLKGFNGNLNMAYSQGKYAKTINSFNFNYRNNKININGRLGYNYNNNFNDLDINRHFLKPDGGIASNFLQNSYIRRMSGSYAGKIEADYYASDKTTWGLEVDEMLQPADENTIATSRFLDARNTLDSTIIANNKQHTYYKNGGMNLNYRHQYDKNGRELTADFDYLNFHNTTGQSFDNKSYLADGALTNSDLLTGNLPAGIEIAAFKTDYTHPLSNGLKLAGGFKSSYTKTNNIADYFYTSGNITSPDYGKTNHFLYSEHINAAYVNVNKDFKRFAIQAGLRFETTASSGHQLGNPQKADSIFKRDYNGLFPTVFLQYKLDTAGKHTISLNYGRRIDRPYYEDLNPFLSPIDKFTYYTGNPFLKPSYTQNVELTYAWANISAELSYSKSTDEVNETIEILNGIYYSRPGNLGSTVRKGITIDASFTPVKWFNFHLFTFLQNIHTVSSFYTGTLNTQGTFYVIRPITEFKLGNDWVAQIDGTYQSKITHAQFVTGNREKINAALSRKLSPATTLKLIVNDVFHLFVNSGDINNLANTMANYRNLSDTRTAVLSLSYRFGKVIQDQRKHNESASESEQNRVKN